MKQNLITFFVVSLILMACGPVAGPEDAVHSSYVVLDDELQQLKDDFNDNQGRVRLLFISGPTCGICLRGMADLNDEFIAASQNDDRLVTFVVQVPALGAMEEHVAAVIPLLDGPRVYHYWNEGGIIGQHYTEVMEVDIYVWDFWTIYGPDARWDGVLPPVPDYYEHQLSGRSSKYRRFPREKLLDAERFATEARKYIDNVDTSRFANQGEIEWDESERLANGTVIPVVAQPRNVAVRQHIMGRGGYKNLKRIQTIDKHGRIEANGKSYALTIHSTRPKHTQRTIMVGDNISVAELTEQGDVLVSSDDDRVLPVELERKLLESFEFDGLLVEWPGKGHELEMIGMLKIGEVLAWKLDLLQKNGSHWHLYVNSHGGALLRADMLDENGDPEYIIRQSDFRETSGFMFARRIDYSDGAGRSLGVEIIEEVTIEIEPFDIEAESIAH